MTGVQTCALPICGLWGAGLFIVLLVVGLVDYVSVRSDVPEFVALKAESAQQRERIEGFEATLAELNQKLEHVREFERKVRIIANLPGSAATGGGQSTNIYAGGVYELQPDEALVIESHIPIPPQYIGFHLSNLWGESHDFANHQSSLNGWQAERDADDVLRWVVAHRDPGVPNWVDTTGHREGFMAPRWAYSETPPPDQWPTISARKVPFDQIRANLPPDTGEVSPEQRREQIRRRQEHVLTRYRVF